MDRAEVLEAWDSGLHVSWETEGQRHTGTILSPGRKDAKLEETGPTTGTIWYMPYASLTLV